MDQYCILGRIGEGAHGIVFKAKHVEVRPRCVPPASSRGLRPSGAETCRPRGSLDACPGPFCCDSASSGGIAGARPLAGGLDIPDLGADLCGYLVPCGFSFCPSLPEGVLAVSALFTAQTGEIVALKKVALRRLEDGIPNQALREIKALQEIEDSQYVSGAGIWWTGRWATGSKTAASPPPSFTHFHPYLPTHRHFEGFLSNPHCAPTRLAPISPSH